MEAVIKVLLDKLPPWGYHLFAVVLAVGLLFYFVRTMYINKKFSEMITDVLKRDERLQGYQEKMEQVQTDKLHSEQAAQQTISALRNMKPFLETLNDLRSTQDAYNVLTDTSFLMQRMLDMIAIDMKRKPGGHHRCGIWLYADQKLTLRFASAGFPKHYVGERQLHVDRSVAGRSYRKQSIIQCADVTRDEDWERNTDSKSPYQTLLCLPLGSYGVMTVDGIEPFSEASRLIGELYAEIATGVLAEHVQAYQRWSEQMNRSIHDGMSLSEEEVGQNLGI
ncbi:GAF domain-containing protein [Paenibacillus arenosi]|uniref:GAF domain-containing protein n=1 Tax=Paenibacillus arenosi TaxID=2774142 RepID=UPI001CDB6745|nr:GAF domain-containing protein [Paenibacillus arenosi]